MLTILLIYNIHLNFFQINIQLIYIINYEKLILFMYKKYFIFFILINECYYH